MKKSSRCPHCGASHWINLYYDSTLVYNPIEYIDEKAIIHNSNTKYIHVRCLECGQEFDVYGEDVNR